MSDYKKMTFTDDFVFCKVLQNNESLCKELLELILDIKIGRIVFSHPQEEIEITDEAKGIRLDVYLEDDANTVFDIEMQATKACNLPKRSRYYQGMIDLRLIERGAEYEELKTSYIIFICMDNIFGGEYHKYEFEYMCRNHPGITLGDKAYKVFLTPDGTADDVSPEMESFLTYLARGTVGSDLTRRIEENVIRVRTQGEWGERYMTLEMKYREFYKQGLAEGRERGIEEGREEGLTEGRIEIIAKLLRVGIPESEIVALGYPIEYIQRAKTQAE